MVVAGHMGRDAMDVERWDSWLRKGAFHRTGLIDQAKVEDILDVFDLRVWDLYCEGQYDDGGEVVVLAGRKRGKPPGVHGRMTDAQVRAAHVLYDIERLSLRGLGGLLWERFGYASAKACANSLSEQFLRLGLPRRDRIEATVAASLKHGRARRKPYRDDADHAAYRRERRRETGEVRGVTCAGVHTQYPRLGEPCANWALGDSDYCRTHDPRYAERVALDLADARRRLGVLHTEGRAA